MPIDMDKALDKSEHLFMVVKKVRKNRNRGQFPQLSTIALLDICPREIKTHIETKINTQRFTAVLSVISQKLQTTQMSVNRETVKLWSTLWNTTQQYKVMNYSTPNNLDGSPENSPGKGQSEEVRPYNSIHVIFLK